MKSKTCTHEKRAKENGSRVRVLEYECTVAIAATEDGKTKLFLDSFEGLFILPFSLKIAFSYYFRLSTLYSYMGNEVVN